MSNTKRMRFPIDIILVCIRWYAAYPLSYRHIEEMLEERGVFVDKSSINRWSGSLSAATLKSFPQAQASSWWEQVNGREVH